MAGLLEQQGGGEPGDPGPHDHDVAASVGARREPVAEDPQEVDRRRHRHTVRGSRKPPGTGSIRAFRYLALKTALTASAGVPATDDALMRKVPLLALVLDRVTLTRNVMAPRGAMVPVE